MKILLISNYLFDAQQSMQRFANLLETGLSQLNHQVRVLRPQPFFGRFRPSPTGFGKWLGYADKFIVFPRTLRKAIAWADVVHICDHSNAFYVKYLQQVPHLVTCNDLLAIRSALGEIPENRTKWTGKQLQKMILNGLNQACRVVCISEKTKQDLVRLSSLGPSAVSRIYMGLNYPYSPMSGQEAKQYLGRFSIPQDSLFIFHVGGNHWYKNRLGVLTIFSHLNRKVESLKLHLVMAGSPFSSEMKQFVGTYDLGDKVTEAGQVSNEELRALYSSAKALLFPSLQEGFGWPIIEAQACGCPAIVSGYSPMTEVGDESVVYIDPRNPEAAADRILDCLPELENLVEKGFSNVQKFSSEKMVLQYVREYESIVQTFN